MNKEKVMWKKEDKVKRVPMKKGGGLAAMISNKMFGKKPSKPILKGKNPLAK